MATEEVDLLDQAHHSPLAHYYYPRHSMILSDHGCLPHIFTSSSSVNITILSANTSVVDVG